MHIDTIITCDAWAPYEDDFRRILEGVSLYLEFPEHSEVTIHGVRDEEIQSYNKEWRKKDKVTDVLSFPSCFLGLDDYKREKEQKYPMPYYLLGDIIVAHPFVSHEADRLERLFKDHVTHLIIHGFLHLLGYDHVQDNDADIMQKEEILLLKQFDIANPYQ